MINETTRVRRNSEVAAHGLGGSERGVLLHLKSGQYHGVDNVGWTIWSLLDGSRSLGELADALRIQYPGAPDHLGEDIREFVQDLIKRDLAEVIPTDPAE